MATYNLVFQGKIIDGASLDEVKANVARLFKADAAKTAVLFSGKTIIIKRNLDSDSAKKYLTVLKKAGALVKAVKIEAETETRTESQAEPAQNTEQASETSSKSSTPLSAGLASLISYNKPNTSNDNDETVEDSTLQLAPLGAPIPNLHSSHDTITIPDLSHLTMSEAESGSLEEFAQKPEPVELPDIDGLSMSEANEGSLEAFATKPEPIPIPDISTLDIAEQDDTPLSSASQITEVVPIPDISALSMSEAQEGSLEGLEKKPEPVPVPDISHLSIAQVEEEQVQGKAVFQID